MAPRGNGRKQRRSSSRYTVDEVAERTDLTARTIRSYQTQGLLASPERHGRVAYYDDSHLERLEEITELKDEGLSLSSIQDVLARREAGARAKASRAKARSKADAAPRPPAPTPSGASVVGDVVPRAFTSGAADRAVGAGPRTTPLPPLGRGPEAEKNEKNGGGRGGGKDSESPRRRRNLVASSILALLLIVAAVSSVIAVLSLSDAAEERKRLGRQVSDLQSDLSRLDGDQGPPVTVVVPGPVQQVPAPETPAATAPPATRTVVVTTPRQAPAAPPAPPPANAPPAAPPTTQPCTLPLGAICAVP